MARKRDNYDLEVEMDTSTQTIEPIEISSTPDQEPKSLTDALLDIRKMDGVIGYIFRGESATIDLNEPDKIIDYAMLSTELCSCIGIIEQIFNVGSVKFILAEGKNAKVLCVASGVNRISIFMANTCDHKKITQKLSQAKELN